MNLLIFEYEHMAIEDLREALTNLGHTYTVITDEIFITMSMKLLMHALTS